MRRVHVWLMMAICLGSTLPAHAAGYMVGEIGPKAIGRGGAFVVDPDDPTAMWLNPAGLSSVGGMQIFVDTSLVRLKSRFVRTCRPEPGCEATPLERTYGNDRFVVGRHPFSGEGGFVGDRNDQPLLGTNAKPSTGVAENISFGRLVPFFALTANGELLGIPGLGLGIALYGPNTGGVQYAADACDSLGTEPERQLCKAAQPGIASLTGAGLWPAPNPDGVQRYSAIESHPIEVLYEAALAYRFNRYLGLGLGLAFETLGTRQRVALSVDKTGRETRANDVDATIDIQDTLIPTAIVGFTSNPIAGLSVGGSFIPPRIGRAKGPVRLNTQPDSTLESEDGLTFDDTNARAIGAFGTPAILRGGMRYALAPYFDVELALVREFWSIQRHVRLEIEDLVVNSTAGATPPLAPTIQPKEWRDTWSVRAGGDFNAIPGVLTMRAGTFYEQGAIPDETFDVSVTDGRKIGVATGFSLGYFGFKLTAAYMHIFIEPRRIERSVVVSQNALNGTPLGGGNTVVALGDYWMSHDIYSLGVVVDVGEVAVRLKGAFTGEHNWWRPEGPQNRTLLDAGSWLQKNSNF